VFVFVDQPQQLTEINAVDDDGRSTAIGPLLAIDGNNGTIVVDGPLWADASDDADGFHDSVPLRRK
jgi:hypothetical protein